MESRALARENAVPTLRSWLLSSSLTFPLDRSAVGLVVCRNHRALTPLPHATPTSPSPRRRRDRPCSRDAERTRRRPAARVRQPRGRGDREPLPIAAAGAPRRRRRRSERRRLGRRRRLAEQWPRGRAVARCRHRPLAHVGRAARLVVGQGPGEIRAASRRSLARARAVLVPSERSAPPRHGRRLFCSRFLFPLVSRRVRRAPRPGGEREGLRTTASFRGRARAPAASACRVAQTPPLPLTLALRRAPRKAKALAFSAARGGGGGPHAGAGAAVGLNVGALGLGGSGSPADLSALSDGGYHRNIWKRKYASGGRGH